MSQLTPWVHRNIRVDHVWCPRELEEAEGSWLCCQKGWLGAAALTKSLGPWKEPQVRTELSLLSGN